MTIREFIEKLKECPQDLTVFVPHNFTPYGTFRPLKWGKPDPSAGYGMEPRCSVETVEDMEYGGEVLYSELECSCCDTTPCSVGHGRRKMKGLIIR